MTPCVDLSEGEGLLARLFGLCLVGGYAFPH